LARGRNTQESQHWREGEQSALEWLQRT
jgi:hypothetical protein